MSLSGTVRVPASGQNAQKGCNKLQLWKGRRPLIKVHWFCFDQRESMLRWLVRTLVVERLLSDIMAAVIAMLLNYSTWNHCSYRVCSVIAGHAGHFATNLLERFRAPWTPEPTPESTFESGGFQRLICKLWKLTECPRTTEISRGPIKALALFLLYISSRMLWNSSRASHSL